MFPVQPEGMSGQLADLCCRPGIVDTVLLCPWVTEVPSLMNMSRPAEKPLSKWPHARRSPAVAGVRP
jgi:hypothetical protein